MEHGATIACMLSQANVFSDQDLVLTVNVCNAAPQET